MGTSPRHLTNDAARVAVRRIDVRGTRGRTDVRDVSIPRAQAAPAPPRPFSRIRGAYPPGLNEGARASLLVSEPSSHNVPEAITAPPPSVPIMPGPTTPALSPQG